MPEPFKHRFSLPLIQSMAECFKQISTQAPFEKSFVFDHHAFIAEASYELASLELKARSLRIEAALLRHLPIDAAHNAKLILASLCPMQTPNEVSDLPEHAHLLKDWALMPVADCIATRYQRENEYFDISMQLLYEITQRFTAEFAIRHFIVQAQDAAIATLSTWVNDSSHHVRRLVSEGTRPRLPWGIQLKAFVRDPSPILPLLEALKDDPSEYVRRSVANNLNDIAKDHPQIVIDICKRWLKDASKERRRLVKHACRTLLKQCHPQVLALFGFSEAQLKRVSLSLSEQNIAMGEAVQMSVMLKSSSQLAQAMMIDYAVYHQKANGTLKAKVFKWKSFTLDAGACLELKKSHSFKSVTTRKYYRGEHKISVLINGKALAEHSFELY